MLKDGTIYTFGNAVVPADVDRGPQRESGEHRPTPRRAREGDPDHLAQRPRLELTFDTDTIVGKVERIRDNAERTVTDHYEDKPG